MEKYIKEAMKIATDIKFFVRIGFEEVKEMTYLELGTYLTTNSTEIEVIQIIEKD